MFGYLDPYSLHDTDVSNRAQRAHGPGQPSNAPTADSNKLEHGVTWMEDDSCCSCLFFVLCLLASTVLVLLDPPECSLAGTKSHSQLLLFASDLTQATLSSQFKQSVPRRKMLPNVFLRNALEVPHRHWVKSMSTRKSCDLGLPGQAVLKLETCISYPHGYQLAKLAPYATCLGACRGCMLRYEFFQ